VKKTKSSKGKKLFFKNETNGVNDPDINTDSVDTEQEKGKERETVKAKETVPAQEIKKGRQKRKKADREPAQDESGEFLPGTAIPEADEIIAEENEPAGQTKTDSRVIKNRGPWQEAFADDNTILIQRTVRSGQSVRFDGNVVVMGDVNPGSEIVASGNIVVMGALRGVVHAGALGNENATVAAFKLQPMQLRIANHITRAPDGDYLTPEYPEIARIKDGVVVIEVYQMGQDRQTKIG